MTTLKADPRSSSSKGRQLRKNGYIPAIVYGKNLDASISIQIDASAASKLLKSNAIGSQIKLTVGEETYSTMLKDYSIDPLNYRLLHLDFQVLTSGEKVSVKASINLLNKDKVPVEGVLQELVSDLEYTALPKDLIDHIDVDLEGLAIGDGIQLKDLAIAQDERYNFHDDPMTDIVHISMMKAIVEEEDEEAVALEGATAEVPVIGQDREEEN